MAEVKKAANDLFTTLEKDGDETLDAKELKGRIDKKSLKVADPDSDKTVSRDEFQNYVEKIFKDADPDNDGTVDEKELSTKQGKSLQRLIQ